MPDQPEFGKHAHPIKGLSRAPAKRAGDRRGGDRAYAELRCKTNFSFLRGASHPEELAQRAAELGYAALAVTDRNTLAGVVRAHCAAKSFGIKLIIGAELTPVDAPPITLYCPDRASYGRLARIITQGRLREIKGSCAITLADIAQWSDGLIAAMHNPAIGEGGTPYDVYREIFKHRLYLTASVHGGPDDERHLADMHALARSWGVPMLAGNDVHYHEPKRRFLQDVLTCIREKCALMEAGRKLFANAEQHLKTIDEMAGLFASYPEAVARTVELATRCRFSLDELRYEYPEALCPADTTVQAFLAELTWAGAKDRYPDGVPAKVRSQIEHELRLIRELSYEPYFLTVWDIVKFARSRNILCQGRGSAANSAVCYCLGITAVDPSRVDLLFERFVSAERNEPPDIDVDFEHERREEVFQYIYGKYGREHAGIVAEVITYRPRSAIRDIGKALGLSLDRVAALAKKHEWWEKEAVRDEVLHEVGLDPDDRTVRMLARLVGQLVGFPRHLSQHVGGFVITRGPLCEMVPIGNGAMPGRTFIEWDKDDIDALGILKIDCLALGMLTAIRKCLDFINSDGERKLLLHTLPPEDPIVYNMICRADTVGVFQIESRAQMSMLPRLKPRCYYDLVIEVAIVRPGPIQGGMVHPYLLRRHGEERVTYP
ncbi:MAG: PHP domain-containing protein, partial [Planctomycetes bacterium]|nr:PHP domain-containing protein [Planctomycetota bacterium]